MKNFIENKFNLYRTFNLYSMIAENNTLNNQRLTSIINETVIADFCSEIFDNFSCTAKKKKDSISKSKNH